MCGGGSGGVGVGRTAVTRAVRERRFSGDSRDKIRIRVRQPGRRLVITVARQAEPQRTRGVDAWRIRERTLRRAGYGERQRSGWDRKPTIILSDPGPVLWPPLRHTS